MLRKIFYAGIVISLVLNACSAPPPVATTSPTKPQLQTDENNTPVAGIPPPATPTEVTVQVDPQVSLEQFPPDGALTVRFSQPMQPGAHGPALVTYPWIEGDLTWNDTGTELTFLPAEMLDAERTYRVMVNKELQSISGGKLSHTPLWSLTVAKTPKILSHSPGAANISVRKPVIRVEFDRLMDRASVEQALSISPQIGTRLEWIGAILSIRLLQPLQPGERYRFVIDSSARDEKNIPLGSDYTWEYNLEPFIAQIKGPQVTQLDDPLTISFNYPVDRASVEQALKVVPDVKLAFKWSGTNQLTFEPVKPLPYNTAFSFSFTKPLLDLRGDELPQLDSLDYTTPAPIIAYTPASGDQSYGKFDASIQFSVPVNKKKTAAAFHVTPEVDGEVTWDDDTLIFHPSDSWIRDTTYTFTLETKAAAADGTPLVLEPFSWNRKSYHNASVGKWASFGWESPNAQVLDSNGRRTIQFMAANDLSKVSFELYQLSLTQFLERYSSGFRGVAGREKVPIQVDDLPRVESWRTSLTRPGGGYMQDIFETDLPNGISAGLYVLEMKAPNSTDQLILVLSSHTLMVKQAGGQLVAWSTDINGEPLPDTTVEIYARDGLLLDQGSTDAEGVYSTHVQRDPQPLIVITRRGEDLTASGLSIEWRSSRYGYFGWWVPDPEPMNYSVYIHTDRPIYRPGQVVHFKAIVRADEDARLSPVPAGTPALARLRDARDNIVQTVELSTNAFGSIFGDFQLGEGAMLGDYNLEVDVESESTRQVFKVQDYRKPDFRVEVSTPSDRYVIGDNVQVDVSSAYFFGEPVADAQIGIRLYLLGETYQSPWSTSGTQAPQYAWYKQSEGFQISGKTDAEGHFTATFPARFAHYFEADNYQYSSQISELVGVEATVEDGSHQEVAGFSVLHVHASEYRLSLRTQKYAHNEGTPFEVSGAVRDLDEQPVGGVTMQLELLRWNQESHRYDTLVRQEELTSDRDGHTSTTLTVDEAGYYQMRLSAIDLRRNPVSAFRWLYILPAGTTRSGSFREALRISTERSQYAPGETAELVIESDFAGPGLLTFERGTTRRVKPVVLVPPITRIPIVITAEEAPNIDITINAWKDVTQAVGPNTYRSLADSQLLQSSVSLLVPPEDKRLSVTITPAQPVYAPREEALVNLQVTDGSGAPVQAEVSLALVDEAIYSLSEELSLPIFDGFYHPRKNLVRTYDSLSLYRYLYSSGMGGGGGEAGSNPRSDFPDTAAWLPALETGPDGKLEVRLTLPDNLTTWRLTARAVTLDTKVGESTATFQTRQAIQLRPILPRGLTIGDQVQLAAQVRNDGEAEQELTVALQAGSDPQVLEVTSPLTQSATLAAGQQAQVTWLAKALAQGEAQLTFSAIPLSGTGGDAIRLPLQIHPLAVPDVQNQVGEFTGGLDTYIVVPPGVLDSSTVKLDLSRSVAGGLLSGLEYLTGYPYGCVEQTMSRALPNAVVGRAFRNLGASSPQLQADLPALINAGLQRLYGYQHKDGGWGWWFDDATDAYNSAWVVFGLSVTQQAGYEVDSQVIARGARWLKENINEMEPRLRAFAIYSLAVAGKGDLEAAQNLLEDRFALDTFSLSGAALALHMLGDDAAASALLDDLADSARIEDGLAYWPEAAEDGYYNEKTMASSIRSTALGLEAFVQIRPDHPLVASIVRWLVSQRRPQGWGSTNETSFTILALTDHLEQVESISSESEYTIEVNGQELASGTLGRGEPAVSLQIPLEVLSSEINQLRVHSQGETQLYYAISSRMLFPEKMIPAAGDVVVQRTYVDAESGRPVEQLHPGQLVRVELSVSLLTQGNYLILEDHLPAGLEALNESLSSTSHAGSIYDEDVFHWQDYGYNNKEVHGDRVSFFITELRAGEYQFVYYARASQAGSFVAMPAEFSAMYNPTVWGRSASATLDIVGP